MQLATVPRRSLLIIDDSAEFCLLLERVLRQVRSGTSLFSFHDGQQAIEHLLGCGTRFPMPDLVLLDCVLTGGPCGFEVLRAIRTVEHLVPLHVLMLSGSDDPRHVDEAREAGADGYIVKPPERGPSYQVLAHQVFDWKAEESWRFRGGTAAGLELAAVSGSLPSGALSSMSAVPSAVATAPAFTEPNMLMQAFHFLRDMVLETFDPIDLAINKACRRHHISPAHARGKGLDQVTVANRHAVIVDLMMEGFGDADIEAHFHVSGRTMERLRGEWRRKGGGTLADGKN